MHMCNVYISVSRINLAFLITVFATQCTTGLEYCRQYFQLKKCAKYGEKVPTMLIVLYSGPLSTYLLTSISQTRGICAG